MMAAGFGVGTYYLCQGLGLLKIKGSEEMEGDKLKSKKQTLVVSGLAMISIGVVYTLEFLAVW